MASSSNPPRELAVHKLIPFTSSESPLLTLFMDVIAPVHAGPWPALLLFHGWNQDFTSQRRRASRLAEYGFCVLNLNLRGRCCTVGEPDVNGWEIRDSMDAFEAAKRAFPQLCAETLAPRAFGVSGGGGNVYALIGKCPDFLCSAAVWCGVSDYSSWWDWNEKGNFRQNMRTWIGGTPRDNEEAYRSRSGTSVSANRICPLRILHGTLDDTIPIVQSRLYADAPISKEQGSFPVDFIELNDVDHLIPEDPYLAETCAFLLNHNKPVYIPQRGRWIVAGYLKTHYFEVRWDKLGLMGSIDMDLRRRRVLLECPSTQAAQIRLAGHVKSAELIPQAPKKCKVLSIRQDAGWTVLDLQMHGNPLGIRWTL